MSNHFDSETRTPRAVLTPEERQQREMDRAIRRAIREANSRYEEERRRLEEQHQQDAQRLREQIEQLNGSHRVFVEQHYRQLEALREEHERQLNEAEERRQRDREQFEGELVHLGAELADLREETQGAISSLRSETFEAIDTVAESVEQLREETREELAKQQQQIQDLATEVHEDKARALETMRVLMEACRAQQSIIAGKQHQKYAPGQLNRIQAKLNGVDALPPTSACAVLCMVFNELLTLDTDIEIAKLAYEKKHLQVLKAVEDVLKRMDESENSISVTDGEDQPIVDENGKTVTINLDYWSGGEYTRLKKKLQEIRDKIQNGLDDPNFTTAHLDEALNEILEINRQQLQLVIQCIQKVKASQVREEMAFSIIKHFKCQFFKVKEQGFENGDRRNAYFIKLYDEYSELVIVINPDESTETNHVIIKTIETELSEPEVDQQNKDINKVLEDSGVEVADGVCHGDHPEVEEGWRVIYDTDVVHEPIPASVKEKARLKDTRAKQNKESANN